jgi:hypothetical protein
MRHLLRKAIQTIGFDIVRYGSPVRREAFPGDVSPEDRAILRQVVDYTMTSMERQLALLQAVRHLVRASVPGCLVECGVWRGGSAMAAVLALLQEKDTSRDIYLFDTYEGMTTPTAFDKTTDGTLAQTQLAKTAKGTGVWCAAGMDDVRANMASTGYPMERVHIIQGPVEATLPAQAPAEPIALLRLDTDWYESTRHELVHLFPRLHEGGIMIIDDYGHWEGARKATEEFFAQQSQRYFLHRIDYTGRLLVKR